MRLPRVPIGPGEVLLLCWMLMAITRIILGRKARPNQRKATSLVWFWCVSALLLPLGSLVAISAGVWNGSAAMRDAAALALAMTFCFVLIASGDVATMARATRLAKTFFVIGALSLGILAVGALVLPHTGTLDLWYSKRLRGWSVNPNQFALLAATVSPLGLVLLHNTPRRVDRLLLMAGLGVSIAVGLMTSSDALAVAWAAAVPATAVLWWFRALRQKRSGFGRASMVYILAPMAMVITVIGLGSYVLPQILAAAEGVYAEGDQGAGRFALWKYGLEALGRSPMVGFGPGSYSGIFGPFSGSEAHNTFIDWGMSTGSIGIAAYCGLLIWIFRYAWKAKSAEAIVALIVVVVFSLFHYVVRHPIFWFSLIAIFSTISKVPDRQRQRRRLAPALRRGCSPPGRIKPDLGWRVGH
jgi:O-antigen ligase